ncbi:MAG: glycosyltransferase family 2 protein [Cyanobacteria bacterium J06639_16]
MPSNPSISIIIRTKNEERWINPCFDAIYNQTYQDFEIIVVDNGSTDKTLEKVKQFSVSKILTITDYLPGKALNVGIEQSVGAYVVCLSAHCIPVGTQWLEALVKALEEDPDYAGVYGRQEPMSFTSPADKRDLLLVFGLDRKIQRKDSFFHNANSIIRRKCWDEVPFDPKITNIEDRIWAQEMLNRGYKMLYEPEASVYHYHGIHQDGNPERLRNVVRIIESRYVNYASGQLDADRLKIAAVIPVKGETRSLNGKPQLTLTIKAALNSQYIDRVFVSTDSAYTADVARQAGAECPFLRPPQLSAAHVNLQAVQKFSLARIEESGYLPDLVVHLEETFPFRTATLLDGMIQHLLADGYDSVIPARPESGWMWREADDGTFKRLDSGDIPRAFKEQSLIGLHGLGCVTHPEFIRTENMTGLKTGLYKIDHPLSSFEVRDPESAAIAALLIDQFF